MGVSVTERNMEDLRKALHALHTALAEVGWQN
jgi:hypothetical protein